MMKIRKILIAVFTICFFVCAGILFSRVIEHSRAERENSEARSHLATAVPKPTPAQSAAPSSPAPSAETHPEAAPEEPAVPPEELMLDDPNAELLRGTDFSALTAINPDVIGWIFIPDTEISYPLLQGTDNRFYLEHTWKKNANSAGSIFLEEKCAADLSDFNTIVYGHRMKNGSMFGCLRDFTDAAFLQAHPDVYIATPEKLYRYSIFAVFESPVTAQPYRLGIREAASKQEFLDYSLAQTVVDTGIVPTTEARVLTLSTCTGRGYQTRWVVQAMLVGEAPFRVTDESVIR